MIVGPLRVAGGQAVEDGGFRLFEIRQFQDGFGSELTFFVSHSCSLHDAAKPPDAFRPRRRLWGDLAGYDILSWGRSSRWVVRRSFVVDRKSTRLNYSHLG